MHLKSLLLLSRFYKFLALVIICGILACNASRKTTMAVPPKVAEPVIKSNPLKIPDVIIPDGTKNDIFMEKILNQYPKYFADILQNRKDYNVQIIYTEINRNSNNQPVLKDYYFNVNPRNYFYPASTVKLPILLLALEKLNKLSSAVTRNTTMLTGAAYSGQTEVFNDPTSAEGRPSIAQYIRKILLTSDNDAYNRLYEFLGHDYINEQLKRKGYESAEIRHRVGISMTETENRYTNPVRFIGANNETILSQLAQVGSRNFPGRKDSLGKGYLKDGGLINQPMDFSRKNRISLEDLHQVLRTVIFPAAVPVKQRFDLTADDYRFVRQYMSQYPRETINPSYDVKEFPDYYGKYLTPVTYKDNIPTQIRIFNKPGNAYGQMLDVAYIVDFDKNIEFFLSAVIYANKDGILTDDKYDYETLALPFLSNLAKVFYEYETKRKKSNEADLGEFKLFYDR